MWPKQQGWLWWDTSGVIVRRRCTTFKVLQSDGVQNGDDCGRAVAEAVANLVDDTELSEVSADEMELSDSDHYDFLPTAGDVFSSDEDFSAPRSRKRQRPLNALRN